MAYTLALIYVDLLCLAGSIFMFIQCININGNSRYCFDW
jgi:hypothetical protein